MLRSLKSLDKFDLKTSEGSIGPVNNFLFDDIKWSVRYLVVNTGGWLLRHSVLISPLAVQKVDSATQSIQVALTREQVERSPDIDTHKPVSRQMEMRYHDYFRWPYYWVGSGTWGVAPYPSGMLGRPYPLPTEPTTYPEDLSETGDDPHLRSAETVRGYKISGKDDVFGHVEDFIIEEESWTIRYLVINTAKFWFEKSVLISPEWVNSVSWSDRRISVGLTKEEIKSSPSYDPNAPVNHDYEARLYDYYGRPHYWVKDSTSSPRRSVL